MAWEDSYPALPGQLAGEDMSTGLTGLDSTGQYLLVKMSADNTHVHCSATSDKPSGVLQNKPKNAGAAAVKNFGVSKVMAGGVLAAGDNIGTDNAGRAVKRTLANTGADTGKFVCGVVIEGASGAGVLAAVMLFPAYII